MWYIYFWTARQTVTDMSKWLLCSSPLTYMEVWQLTLAQYPFISAHLHCSLYPKQLNVTDRNFFFSLRSLLPIPAHICKGSSLAFKFLSQNCNWMKVCMFFSRADGCRHAQSILCPSSSVFLPSPLNCFWHLLNIACH